MAEDPTAPVSRGRPRSELARLAILDATTELLLAEGLEGATMDAVAERAGVAKSTIYRWWPTKEQLALDALYRAWAAPDPGPQTPDPGPQTPDPGPQTPDPGPQTPDLMADPKTVATGIAGSQAPDPFAARLEMTATAASGSLREDLVALLVPWVEQLRERPYGRVIAAFISEAQTDPAFEQQYLARFVEPRRDEARAMFARAADRGQLSSGTDFDLALDLVYGPLYHRLLHRHAPLSAAFVTAVVDAVLAGLGC